MQHGNSSDAGKMISKRAAGLSPYTPGEQPRDRSYIKLNTNENPYPPAPAVEKRLRKINASKLRLYPDPEAVELRKKLSEVYGPPPASFFAGNGSDEVLSFIFYAFFDGSRGPLLFPEHTYSFYPVYCSFYDIPYRRIPLKEDFRIDPDVFLRETDKETPTGIIFPNPNAPTGAALSREQVEGILNRLPPGVPLVVDEAYVDFGAESSIPLVEHYENLIVVQTFSKNRSLAGMRIGYAVSSAGMIEILNTVKNSFNSYPLNRMSQAAAVTSLEEAEYFERTRGKIIATRERTVQRMSESGWYIVPSSANFIFARHPSVGGGELYRKLKERGILVRHFGHRGIEEFVRISIGTDEQMDSLIDTLEELTQAVKPQGGKV